MRCHISVFQLEISCIYRYLSIISYLNYLQYIYIQLTDREKIYIYTYLNHSMRWCACPPCLQVWHQVNHEVKLLSFLLQEAPSLLGTLDGPSAPSSTARLLEVELPHPEGVPMCTRHREQRGRGFLQLGQACIWKMDWEHCTHTGRNDE